MVIVVDDASGEGIGSSTDDSGDSDDSGSGGELC